MWGIFAAKAKSSVTRVLAVVYEARKQLLGIKVVGGSRRTLLTGDLFDAAALSFSGIPVGGHLG